MICPKCKGEWTVKKHDGRLYNICEDCGYVDMRDGTVDGVPVGPTSPRLDSNEHFVFEEQREEIAKLRDEVAAAKAVIENIVVSEVEPLKALLRDCERAIIVGDLRGNVGRRIRAALGDEP